MAIETKQAFIGFRATRTDQARIRKVAAKLKLRLSEYVRLCVLNDIAKGKP